ncbi:MAG: Gfo/Idh/MocA family oxidoreductase [bacterium]
MKRRSFLKTSAAASLAISVPAIGVRARGKKYKTALIGTGWWGMNICMHAMGSGECQIIGMCDVDRNQLDPAVEKVKELSGDEPRKYVDYRELLEKEKPEIVIVATPDHWHALPMIAACEMGAHVYVEKPICHTINEGIAMVNAAREADRVVQVGTHRRAGVHNRSGMEFLKSSGKVGKISMVRAFVHYGGGPGEPVPDEETPEGLDWNMWSGPAPLCRFNPAMHPRGFRYFLDYANGQLGDWGIHWMDQILWWSEETYPKKVSSVGGRHVKRDNTNQPDTQIAIFEFDSFTACWEHRLCAPELVGKSNIGVNFYGTDGTFHMGWMDGWTFYPRDTNQPTIHEDCVFENKYNKDNENIGGLWADLLDCIKTKKRPICDIEIGHRSTTMSLLGMLSLKSGRSVDWDGEKQVIIGDEEANKLLCREYRAPWKYPAI